MMFSDKLVFELIQDSISRLKGEIVRMPTSNAMVMKEIIDILGQAEAKAWNAERDAEMAEDHGKAKRQAFEDGVKNKLEVK